MSEELHRRRSRKGSFHEHLKWLKWYVAEFGMPKFGREYRAVNKLLSSGNSRNGATSNDHAS